MTTQKNLCDNPNSRVRREAVPGSAEVYPMMKDKVPYGAILLGEHYFYQQEDDKPEQRTGIAKYTHLWILEDGAWKMSRILSFDHAPAASAPGTRKAITLPHSTLDLYAGTYEGPQSGTITVEREYGTLLLREWRTLVLCCFPETETQFSSRNAT
ncbi:MAG: hypothetical protein IPL65_06815 [Lewinellaceae bacterium]|nr:hypothetical protein [Lewinellaceae bacterium]